VIISQSRLCNLGILLASSLVIQANCAGFAALTPDSPKESDDQASSSFVTWSGATPISALGPILSTAANVPPMQPVYSSLQSESFLDTMGGERTNKIAAASTTINAPLSATVTATPEQTPPMIDNLTKQILLKEIELERFNLHYKIDVAKQGRWKGWRYAFFNEANAGLTLSGAILSVSERGTHLHQSPKKSSRSYNHVHISMQENNNILSEIGNCIGAYAAVQEFAINGYHDFKARQHGFSPGAAREHVLQLKGEINNLLAQRDALMKVEHQSASLSGRCEIDDCEGNVLKDLRDQSLLEFERFQISARRVLAFQQSQYFFDFSKNVMSFLGYEFGYLALHRHDRKWNLKSGVCSTISGGIFACGPIASRGIGHVVASAHRHWLEPTTQDCESREVMKLEQDQKALDALCKSGKVAPDMVHNQIDHVAMYSDQSKVFQDEVQAASRERNKAVLTATQNVGSGIYVGGSKIAGGILFIIPGFYRQYSSYTNPAKKSYSDLSSKVTNTDFFVSSVITIPAATWAMFDTLRIQVGGEINRHKLAQAGMLPGQLVVARLKQLDALEARVKAQ
jgi:hypothetical protein